MSGMMDARCSRCGRRYGWAGKPTDAPSCPKCGNPPDLEALKRDEEHMEEFRRLLLENDMSGDEKRELATKLRKLVAIQELDLKMSLRQAIIALELPT